jgi:hypothetical protein
MVGQRATGWATCATWTLATRHLSQATKEKNMKRIITEWKYWMADRREEKRIGYPKYMISGPNPIKARWIKYTTKRRMNRVKDGDSLATIITKLTT